ncbi:MAG: bifunctional DNA-binding transcriptional regulator/O6-methylguanine-DNA methyltransferase Ada [Nannocystaceae bacterium]|nr:bifunctional DNA-binding transcriptional regulator/O6-methylguanine-DNA methyltransferase Ada [Nannocystaceae bacterium]
MPSPTQLRAASVQRDPRWAAILDRDEDANGQFVYSVRTTGVYCRPSCGSRRPKPENVAFHERSQEARSAGFRACKRCDPDGPTSEERRCATVEELCRFIERSDEPPSLQQLADHAGLSPSYTHRMFKSVTGVTPRAYASANRARRLRSALKGDTSITTAIYEAGYNSSARFYEKSSELLGMTPTQFRKGAAELPIRFAVGESSLGSVLVAATARGVCAILLGDDPEALVHELERQFPATELVGADQAFEALVANVVGLVEDPTIRSTVPLDIRGTAFQRRVWDALRKVPAGRTVSYSELAGSIGAPRAARAVAQACARNTLAVAIPCHRVVRADGSLSGYRWGIERKGKLLDREGRE